ncbi:MAG: hypothetical protein JWP29_675 [Rhodoferax sp.]|nr:hypothetical protein [Rhodoferax sp.]
MIKLPTQFDARSSHSADAAAAGGCTSTTCSSCVVTLGVSSVLTSMHFQSLTPVGGKFVASKPVASKLATDAAPVASRSPGQGPGILGFFLPLLSFIASGLGLMSGSVTFAAFLFAGAWGGVWVSTYGDAARSGWRGLLISMLALVAMAVLGVVEAWLWLKH